MVFNIGLDGFLSSFYKVWPNTFTKNLAGTVEHAGWQGFNFYDLIFPLFLFLVGLILPTIFFSHIEKGENMQQIHLHILKRTLVLIFLGLVNYGLLRFNWETMRWSTVLGRIGICYFIASMLVIHSNWKIQTFIVFIILIVYWAAVMFIPVPGYGPGVLTPEGCLTTWLDQKLIPGALGLGLYDRQGVLSTFTAIASTLIGVLAGHWLRSDRTPNQKTIGFYYCRIDQSDSRLDLGTVFLYQQECLDEFICVIRSRLESAVICSFLLGESMCRAIKSGLSFLSWSG